MARGSVVAYLDDDNLWRQSHLESLVELLGDPDIEFAFASLRMGGEDIICRRPRRMQIDTSALVHRRSLLDRHGYWGPSPVHDWELVSGWGETGWAASLRPTVIYRLRSPHRRARLLEAVRAVAEEERRAAIEDRGKPLSRPQPGRTR
jgi:hypothetical protein